MDDPEDVAVCTRCRRWQRRRHAHAEDFGPGDREEWCVTGGCVATWNDGVSLTLSARHDPDDERCLCASCREVAAVGPPAAVLAWAADHGFTGEPADLEQATDLTPPGRASDGAER